MMNRGTNFSLILTIEESSGGHLFLLFHLLSFSGSLVQIWLLSLLLSHSIPDLQSYNILFPLCSLASGAKVSRGNTSAIL